MQRQRGFLGSLTSRDTFPALIKALFRCVRSDSGARPCKVFRVAAKHAVKEVKTPGNHACNNAAAWDRHADPPMGQNQPEVPVRESAMSSPKLACWRAP